MLYSATRFLFLLAGTPIKTLPNKNVRTTGQQLAKANLFGVNQ